MLTKSTVPERYAFIDALKAIASQLIVLHHLAFYGPMSNVAYELFPSIFTWLSRDARMAVQIFLVIGGFLAVQKLSSNGVLKQVSPLKTLFERYLKLIIPFGAAILISIPCSMLANALSPHPSIPAPPTITQLFAHFTLTQSLLGLDSLSAGVWYVAIDFQLFTVLLIILWIGRAFQTKTPYSLNLPIILVILLAIASLYYFNRFSHWDNWAVYFFAAYALGVLTYWIMDKQQCFAWIIPIVVVVGLALYMDYRARLLIALLTALALFLVINKKWFLCWMKSAIISYLGRIAYSVFLIHFPVILLVNALFSRLFPANPAINLIGIILAWMASIVMGGLFYHYIESRVPNWQIEIRKWLY